MGLAISICSGLFLAWMDSRPGWDDTGITVGLIVLTAARFFLQIYLPLPKTKQI